MEPDVLVRDYLGRLDAAAWPLSAGRRAELSSEVMEHIDAALSEAGRRDEATVRNVLDRLGPPEEIVAAEASADPAVSPVGGSAGAAAQARSQVGAIEIIALLLLTVGAILLPLIGPALGLVFVWLSTLWSVRIKLIATAIVVAVLVLPILGLLSV